jgi:ribosome biogenesis GTPase
LGEEDGTGALEEILPRRNFLVRPPLANLDQLFIVSSLREPYPEPLIIDKTIAVAELEGIQPALVLTKTDLEDASSLKAIYDLAGVPCLVVSSVTGEGVDQVRKLLAGKVSAFTGNSGVGKSTLLNALFPQLELKTGEISQKLGRGRHTTREVELYKLEDGGYVADTPGFSTFEIERYRLTEKERLVYGFREFEPYLGQCQFTSCSHTCEKGCAILQAVEEGKIARSRHESYCAMYQEIKDVKQWQQKNKNA